MILVLSLDGICHEDVDLSSLPNLSRLASKGVYTKRLCTVFPSVTWNIHTSVITGKPAGLHGIWGNTAYSRSRKMLFHYFEPYMVGANDIWETTIFQRASEKRLISAAVCWPLTQGNPHLSYNVPEFYKQECFRNFSTPELIKELTDKGVDFNSYAAWSQEHLLAPLQDHLTTRIVEYLINEKTVDVLFTHFLIHDSFQHHFGIHTPESKWSMAYADSMLGILLDCLQSNNLLAESHIIVFSDHGHEAVDKYFDLDAVLRQIDVSVEDICCADNGGALFLYIKRAPVPCELVSRLKKGLQGHEAVETAAAGEEVFRSGLDYRLNPDTFPDIVVSLRHGWFADKHNTVKSSHGYNPETHKRMDGFMIRSGAGFPAGVLEETGHICHIYGIIDKLLEN